VRAGLIGLKTEEKAQTQPRPGLEPGLGPGLGPGLAPGLGPGLAPGLGPATRRALTLASVARPAGASCGAENPATQNRTRDHLIPATVYSQMLYQLSYSRLVWHDQASHCSPVLLGRPWPHIFAPPGRRVRRAGRPARPLLLAGSRYASGR
jgi:hypothetical protein